ncbi:MAG: AbrB/MazE/SpoVT family DNA-binding domain-containing protein [Tildeniella nuda ZEHNDER 1965/U140]|jgi:AbrB family looped-hinge helix DNA binding protein|nr:AbrB/MazE/SpoVT family DNA-binding domain-containing protein [Tildeniella nuda ZEHNDER 1965/U140]
MPKTTVSADGQIIIPKEVLDFLKLQAGDEIDFLIEEDGKVIVQSASSDSQDDDKLPPRLKVLQEKLQRGEKIHVHDLKGMLHREGDEPMSIEAMDELMKQHVASKVLDH